MLVVGAGAVGGYFGARLVQAGRDVTFLVRPARAAVLSSGGLTVHPFDASSFTVRPSIVTTDELASTPDAFDLVLLSVKSYALEQALDDIAPAVGESTTIVPLLNGLRHIDVLRERFGAGAVAGGLCLVSTQLDADGGIRQLGAGARVVYGAFGAGAGADGGAGGDGDGGDAGSGAPVGLAAGAGSGIRNPVAERMPAIDAALSDAGFATKLSTAIERDLWEKWVLLAAGGALTTLLRGTVGSIVAAPGGAEVARSIAAECFAVAEAAGFAILDASQQRSLATLTQPGSSFATSMYRDLVEGNEVEADQILGDLVRRASGFGVATPLLGAAYAGLEIYRAGRG